ncbi:PREDICTED: uncharacterized protein LOC105453874 [Wasmannia auropunctata]|uniref:uncharacterized protein LOC105453874 n=1 Tax=Wasmannia auropunctata TaxID=64793 RepID=UPI0005EFCBC7|nr:PREDICTED: uncharacterized protein LOC105453874 [Wasmannia auropunctata]
MIFLNVSVFICLHVVMTLLSVRAYEIERGIVFSNADVPSNRKSLRNFFLDLPFLDKSVGPQTSAAVPMRDRTVGPRALRDVFLKDRAVYPFGFSIFRDQPIKQNSFASFRDKPLFKDAILKNQELRGERAVLGDNPFVGQLLAPEGIFEGQVSTYGSRAPFKEQLFTAETPLKNLFRGQSSPAEQASFQKQPTIVETPPAPDSIEFHRDDYIKPIDSYERYKDIPTTFDGKSTIYTKHDEQAPGWSSLPMVPFSEYLLPLSAEMPRTPPSTPVIVHGRNPVSSVSPGMGEAHSSEASKMELGPLLTSASNCNASVDSSPTTVPSISVSTNQSSIVGHILTSLTTKPSSPVMATSIAPSAGNILEPIYFHATKHGAVTSPLPTLDDVHAHALSHTPKSSLKINEHDFKFLALEAPKNVEIQSSMLNYILPEEHKSGLKGIQNSFANYALPVKFKQDWPLQQFSQPETSSGYAPPSAVNGKAKLILPNIPVAPISWPIEIKSDISTMLSLKSIMTPDAATRNKLLLGIDLPVDFTASIPNSLTSNTPNGISGSITDGISTGIPGGMTTNIPASIPTLNLGQSLHHVEQLRPTQEARNPWYPTDAETRRGRAGI